MSLRPFVFILLSLFNVFPLLAHDIITTNLTFTRDISRIFAARCNACHGPGATIPLTTYQEVRPWAVSIKEQVLSRAMPPWGAVKGFGDFSPDYGLTQEEITIIAAWVVGGAPQGNPLALDQSSIGVSRGNVPSFLHETLDVQTRTTLAQSLLAAGIKPLEDRKISSAKLIARLPDGRVQPLLWLYDFDGGSKRGFTFRAPLSLPAGTVIESSTPLRFSLETRSK